MSHYCLYDGGQKSLRVILYTVHNSKLQKQAELYGRGEERDMATWPSAAVQQDLAESNVFPGCELMFLKFNETIHIRRSYLQGKHVYHTTDL